MAVSVPVPAATALASAPAPAKPYYPALSGIRAVAALLVFANHFRPVGMPHWADQTVRQFHFTMSIFFMLSGFVLATNYQQLAAGPGAAAWYAPARVGPAARPPGWWRRYFWRRVARVYPMYLLLNTTVLWHVYWPVPPGQWGHTLTLVFLSESLLRGFSDTLKYVGLPQAWSLTAEECFYFSLPLLLWLWQRRGWRGAAAFAAGALALGLGLTALCQGRPALHGFFGSYYHLFSFTFFGRVLEFSLGVGLARWQAARAARPLGPGWPGSPVVPWRTVAGGLLLAVVLAALLRINSPVGAYEGVLDPRSVALNVLAFPVAFTLLLAGLLREQSWLRAVLGSRFMDEAGRRTYAFYLVQIGLLSIWWQGHFGFGGQVAAQLLVTLLLSEVLYRGVEEPARKWLLAKLKIA